MKKILVWCLLIGFSSLVQASNETDKKGDPEKGAQLAKTVCAACHSADGNSAVAMYPKLAGQHEHYLTAAMTELKKGAAGKRNNPIMSEQMKNLSAEDIQNVAAYFAKQTMSAGGAVEKMVPVGQAVYRGGNSENGIPACLACHGPDGKGNGPARFPRVAGQQVDYLIAQLKAFRSGERTDIIGGMMNDVAKKLTDEEIQAVSSYISGLH